MKKYKVEIPEGYEFDHESTGKAVPELESLMTTIVFKKVKKELPKTWEEYCDSNKIPQWLESWASIPEKHKAQGKLVLLRDHYNDGWKPSYKSGAQNKYYIGWEQDEIAIGELSYTSRILSFKTGQLRDEFLSNFAQLIEEAKSLL